MAGGGDRQKLCQPLDNAEQDGGVKQRHGGILRSGKQGVGGALFVEIAGWPAAHKARPRGSVRRAAHFDDAPASITTMRSAWRTVARRCAITSVVRLHQALQRILHQPLAFGIQRAGGLVEQQDRRIAQMARAMAMRWRWPPDRRAPFSPRNVSSPSGNSRRKLRHWRRGRRPRSPHRGSQLP
jgi:hypothetical protein